MAKFQPLVMLHGQPVSIDTLLDIAGAKRYTAAEIEAHKAQELAKAPPANRLWKHRYRIDRWINDMTEVGISVAIFSFLGFLFMSAFVMAEPKSSWISYSSSILAKFFLAMVVLGSLSCFVASRIGRITIRGPAEWRPHSTERYVAKYGPLPESAERIVHTVRSFAPQYRLRVQILENNYGKLDPVLEVVAPDGSFRAVDIWD